MSSMEARKPVTKRQAPGEYTVTLGGRTVNISCLEYDDGPGWVASASWDIHLSTDPLPRKWMAVENAVDMLVNPLPPRTW